MSFRPEGEIPTALILNGSQRGFLTPFGMTDCMDLVYLLNKQSDYEGFLYFFELSDARLRDPYHYHIADQADNRRNN